MTRSIVKMLTKPLYELERELRRLGRAAWRLQQNEYLAIARRNLFNDEASSSNNTGTKPPTPPKTLHEPSHPNSSGLQNPIILLAERTKRIINSCDILLIRGTCTFQGLRSEDPLCHIKHYLSIVDNIQADRATRDASRLCFFHFSLKGKAAAWGRLKRACNQIFYLKARTREVGLKNPYLISDYCGGSYEADECRQNNPAEQKKDDDDERLLSIFKQIHINLPFLEAMIHMPKGYKVLKDLISHKEKLEKAASLVKLSEECSAIIQRSLPQKEGNPGSSHCHVLSDPGSKECLG
nr:hypothetical protein [Tanacetum cinerariifolium]